MSDELLDRFVPTLVPMAATIARDIADFALLDFELREIGVDNVQWVLRIVRCEVEALGRADATVTRHLPALRAGVVALRGVAPTWLAATGDDLTGALDRLDALLMEPSCPTSP